MINGCTKTRPAAWLIPLLIAVLALALPAAGEAAVPGSISGTVTAKVGGQPLLGVEVCAEDEAEEAYECTSTDASGRYEILELPAGSYKVEFWARNLGFADQFYDGKSTWATATPVPVNAGVPTTGIDAEMEKGGTISGIVTAAATGLPVANAVVCVESTNGIGNGCSEETTGTGAYAVRGLPAGFYKVEFWAGLTEENVLTTYYPSLVSVAAGVETFGINGALPAGGEVEGTVRAAATGAPLAGVQVCLTGSESAWVGACLSTPPSGAYRFYAIETGSYKVVFSPEANEIEKGESWEIVPDAFPTQWWNGQPTFAAATPIGVVAGSTVSGVDGSLGPGPVATPQPTSAPPAAAPVMPKPKPLKCKRSFVKKKVEGKARCVRRHKPKRHHHKHHPKPRTAHSK